MDFNNSDWGYIMDIAIATIVGTLIAVAGSILVNCIINSKGYKDIKDKMGELPNTTLSGEHKKISDDIIRSVEKENKNVVDKIGILNNTTLSGQNTEIINKVNNIDKMLFSEIQKSNVKYDNLTEKQKDLKEQIKSIEVMMKELERLQTQDINQKQTIEKLQTENTRLKEQINELYHQKSPILSSQITDMQTSDFTQTME